MAIFSIVIVCKNESDTISTTLSSLVDLTDDIVVFDNGSTDGTQAIVQQFKVKLHEGAWEGFGKTKRKATSLAANDWILNLDADEALDEELRTSLKNISLADEKTVYDLNFKNFLGDTHLKYGEWGNDHHIRLFNRRIVNYDEAPVHENLVLPPNIVIKKLKGYVLHRTMKDVNEYGRKMVQYAALNAEKYFQQGKKSYLVQDPNVTWIHIY